LLISIRSVNKHGQNGFGGEDFKKSANQKQELPVMVMFVNRSGQNERAIFREDLPQVILVSDWPIF
jgi:hypothetical protein